MVGLIRRFWLVPALVLAVGIPYVLHGDSTGSLRDKLSSVFSAGEDSDVTVEGIDDPNVARLLGAPGEQLDSSQSDIGDTPIANLESVLRFDVTPRWVMSSWPHVTTTRSDNTLDGLRVALITGTQPHDVVGSLTYYFDKNLQLQRIALDGVVGDERHLVSVATQSFHLRPEHAAGVGMFLAKWNGKPTSALWIRRLPVVRSDNPLRKYQFSMELNRPKNYYGLSSQFQNRLNYTQANNLPVGTTR